MTEAQTERPATATISGVEVVTIPLTHYAELLDCQRRVAMGEAVRDRRAMNARLRIDRDPEVAAYLAECLGRKILKDTYTSCRERFGAERTPGHSTIQRYWARLGRRV